MSLNEQDIRNCIQLIRCSDNGYGMHVNVYRINYFDKENRKIRVHMNTGIYIYNGTFRNLQESLPDNFVKIARGIIFKTKRTRCTINPDEILYVEKESNDLIIHTKENTHSCRNTLREYRTELSDDFFRIHNNYIVNLKHIFYITGKIVKMSNGDELPISQLRRKELLGKLEDVIL